MKLFIKYFRIPLISTIFCLFFNVFVFADIVYPEFSGKLVNDQTNSFSQSYLSSLESKLEQSPREIRILFIDTKNQINLGIYAPKLFDKWEMTEDSLLVVIDPFLNKTGYGIGKKLREELRKRKIVYKDEEEKSEPDSENNIDYDNLADAIVDKFSLENEIVQENNKEGNKPKIGQTESNGTGGFAYSDTFSKNSRTDNREDKPSLDFINLKNIIIVLIISLLAGIGFFIYKKRTEQKRQSELITNYTFDADILSQDLDNMIEKINNDYDKLSKYQGLTADELQEELKNLKEYEKEANQFYELISKKIESINNDNPDEFAEFLEEGNIILQGLIQAHKEAVIRRKDYKSIFEKSSMLISDIRVNIENLKNNLEEIRTISNLKLDNTEEKIINAEQLMNTIGQYSKKDPVKFQKIMEELKKNLKEIKSDLDIIPHLYSQLQENIPLNISSSLEESIIDNAKKSKIRNEINDIRNNALIYLSKGNLKQSEELLNKIFSKINEIRSMSEIS